MKFRIIISMIFAMMMLVPVSTFAQSDISVIVPEIENPPDCDLVTYSGQRAWLPFEIRAFYDFNREAEMKTTLVGNSNPITTQTPRTYFFSTSEIDEYNVEFKIPYDTVKSRAVLIEIISAGELIQKDVIPYNNAKFCKSFHIITSEKPVLPTLEDAYGTAIVTMVEQVPEFVPAFKASITNTNNALAFIGFGIAVMLLFGIINLIVFMSRKKNDKRLRQEVLTASNSVSKNLKATTALMEDVADFKKKKSLEFDSMYKMFEVVFRTGLLEMKKEFSSLASYLQITKEEQEQKFYDETQEILKKSEELDKMREELDSVLNVKDESKLRTLISLLPTENIKSLLHIVKQDNNFKTNTVSDIADSVLSKRDADINSKYDDSHSIDNSVIQDDIESEDFFEEDDEQEPMSESHTEQAEWKNKDADMSDDDNMIASQEKTDDFSEEQDAEHAMLEQSEDEEKICENCAKEKHCNGSDDTCDCECCFEVFDMDGADWRELYNKLDYEGVREEWERISNPIHPQYQQRAEELEKMLKKFGGNADIA